MAKKRKGKLKKFFQQNILGKGIKDLLATVVDHVPVLNTVSYFIRNKKEDLPESPEGKPNWTKTVFSLIVTAVVLYLTYLLVNSGMLDAEQGQEIFETVIENK